ncbi:39S ribosomal protein L46, mitochondrial [Eumeta japonica]|uniref:39S ribosomal protein L46, mitochondrial n=1 Tax=Eumeta variegata TaxID=151549 RepID=A0A4C1Z6E9_EUMVA|nr:39S ribosomal protein L46, mitochondrial [Eumeta japonica]
MLKNEANDVDMEAVSKITAQDFEDAANEELTKFKFADIQTEADKKGDKTSIERVLQRHLVLVSEHILGSDKKTLLPQDLWKQGETLRQTAERILLDQCGPQLKVNVLGNAPCGFHKYKYPKDISGKVGAKPRRAGVSSVGVLYVRGGSTPGHLALPLIADLLNAPRDY